MEDLEKYKDAFLSEAKEHVEAMNNFLLKLEKSPDELELVSDIFREAHTLKSMAATMNYDKTAQLCHAIEDVLDAIRNKKIEIEKCVDILFQSFDHLESSLKEISRGKEELDTRMLVERLKNLTEFTGDEPQVASRESPITDESDAVEKITSIEVKVERLDLLMNLAEELLITNMRLDRIKEDLQNAELSAAVDNLGRLIADVQYNVMQARMVPMGFVFNRFPRMVRDLAKLQKKEVSLKIQGGDIELDRSVVDEIGESLVHLLRNAVDHGIETPQERNKSDRPPQGTIKLTATRTKDFAIIEVFDDGAGLDIEEIKESALKRGILSPEPTKEEVIDSVFSGVSTTKEVTEISGRGFGLNIVKEKIESLAGSIQVESEIGKGTKFVIKIPLTLAIIKTLFVEVGGRTYAIPLANIDRLVSVSKEDIKGMLNYEAIVLNEENIPITRLNVLFGTPSLAFERQPIVIVRKEEEKLGLAVDALMTTQEIVLKPLNRLTRENKYFAGFTIIGSGEVVLILDIANLILSKRVQPQRTQRVQPPRSERRADDATAKGAKSATAKDAKSATAKNAKKVTAKIATAKSATAKSAKKVTAKSAKKVTAKTAKIATAKTAKKVTAKGAKRGLGRE